MTRRIMYLVTDPISARYLLVGQLARMREAGFVVALASSGTPDLALVAKRDSIQTYTVPMARGMSPGRDLQSVRALVNAIRAFSPTIVNASTPKAGFLGMVAAAAVRVPRRIFVLRGLRSETMTGLSRNVVRSTERISCALADRVVCVSESLRFHAIQNRIVSARKATVLGPGSSNGVDTHKFTVPDRDQTALARRILGVPPHNPVIGFVGRLTADKGISDLVRAFEHHVLPQHPKALLLLAGHFESGDPVPLHIRRRISASPQIVHLGFLSDTSTLYHAIDVLAFPSYREGFPNAPLEAAASGLPTVAYRSTGCVDAIVDGTTGTLVDVGRVDLFGTSIARYLSWPELRRRHGFAANHRSVNQFDASIVHNRWVAFHERMLHQR